MPSVVAPSTSPRIGLVSAPGVTVEALADGALTRFEAGDLSLVLYPSTAAEAGPANVHLRRHDAGRTASVPLLGPAAPGGVVASGDAWTAAGTWEGLSYRLTLRLSTTTTAWTWSLEVVNDGPEPVVLDAVLTHDPALAPPGAVRTNEYYVSQYLDISPVTTTDHGTALAVRQNMPGPRSPWMAVACLGVGLGWATDAGQLVSRTPDGVRWTGLERAELPSRRWQHEHALLALQSTPTEVAPGRSLSTGFVGVVREHHPDATGPADAAWLDEVIARASAGAGPAEVAAAPDPSVPSRTAALLALAPALSCRALTGAEVERLGLSAHPGTTETDGAGAPSTWRTDRGEVVTAARELQVLRPHGQILRTGDRLVPDPGSLTSTVWMAGTFHSQVTRGHVGRDTLVSGRRSYLGLFRGQGVRIAVDRGAATWRLLDTPSAWCAGLDECSWWYATDDGLLLEVVARGPSERHALGLEVNVLAGPAVPLRVTVHLDDAGPSPSAAGTHGLSLAGWLLTWDGATEPTPDDEWLVLDVAATTSWSMSLTADADDPDDPDDRAPDHDGPGADFWPQLSGALSLDLPGDGATADQVAAIDAATPWFAHNALVHYLSPRGLEQFSGGGWGTRDVCQGPVGLLTALDRPDEVRDVLLRVFRAQNERGDWPQAFEFLPPLAEHGQQDAHGDVVYWPLLALGEHLQASGDASILDEQVAFVGDQRLAPAAPVAEHVRRALQRIESIAVPGTPLPAYGHGDWNDSLQPADPELARRLTSTWTAVLQVQALEALAVGLGAADGAHDELTKTAATLADRTRAAITETLLVDGVLPGYLLMGEDGAAEPLVHPRDTRTGLTYGILPWVHAVAADVLDPEASREHLALIERHLLGPDGARLFDRPVTYRGGPMTTFQRAEASTFWGREIGLMYVHAHLRYAEALARVGDGAGLLRALSLTSPWGLTDRVPQSRPRQRSCYYSSSDGVFADRYDASDRYSDLMAGDVPVEGGWRIYSSGPGLALRLVVERLLGLRRRADLVEVDPVLPAACDGLVAGVRIAGHPATVRYAVGPEGVGVRRLLADARPLDLLPLANPHRRPGVSVRTEDLRAALAAGLPLLVETY